MGHREVPHLVRNTPTFLPVSEKTRIYSSHMSSTRGFDFVDLFAGIGGFHAALSALGGELVLAPEKEPHARETYKRNWGTLPENDVIELANARIDDVPDHAILAGGFPCQPFSKSGRQLGMQEERGQVFDELLKILEARRPPVVLLENVRNLAGPRQIESTWRRIIGGLRAAGYLVSDTPLIVSPHRLPARLGGAPQSRERVFILGTHVGREKAEATANVEVGVAPIPDPNWDPSNWDILDGFVDAEAPAALSLAYSADEREWLRAWNDFLYRTRDVVLPGHPLWSDYWNDDAVVDESAPPWKQRMESQNLAFFDNNRSLIRAWQRSNPHVVNFPLSRRKFEWQGKSEPRDITHLMAQLRPSGIRVKPMSYAPALVAMTQTPLLGPLDRKISSRESARLQGFPDWFQFDHQPDKITYKQLGNAVNVGVAYYVIRSYLLANSDLVSSSSEGRSLVDAARASPTDPRLALVSLGRG